MNSIDETALIDLVRNYPLLYDLTSPLYNDQQKKEEAWNEISTLVSASGKCVFIFTLYILPFYFKVLARLCLVQVCLFVGLDYTLW